MNFICATIELIDGEECKTVEKYGNQYFSRIVSIPGTGTQLNVLVYADNDADPFVAWSGGRALINGQLFFQDKQLEVPLDVVVSQYSTGYPDSAAVINQVVMGNCYFQGDESDKAIDGKYRIWGQDSLAVKVGTTMDDANDRSFFYMVLNKEFFEDKINARFAKGRDLCVLGRLEEARNDNFDAPLRKIIADDFTNRARKPGGASGNAGEKQKPVVKKPPAVGAHSYD